MIAKRIGTDSAITSIFRVSVDNLLHDTLDNLVLDGERFNNVK